MFDDAHKVRLPLLPQKIGAVTSPTGAAIQDMLRILNRRNASLHVLIYPARVQGTGAAEEIAAGVKYFNTRDDIDVIIVARGGGSMEDLWAFNEEIVARAIYDSRIPVISAVGHEVDFTIADFVADLRAPTPSAAAEMVSGAREDLQVTVQSFSQRALQAVRLLIERRRSGLERLARNRAFNVTPNKVRELQQSFDESTLKMNQNMLRRLVAERHRERVLQMRLVKVDLRQALARNREVLSGKRNRLVGSRKGLVLSRRSRLGIGSGADQRSEPAGNSRAGIRDLPQSTGNHPARGGPSRARGPGRSHAGARRTRLPSRAGKNLSAGANAVNLSTI